MVTLGCHLLNVQLNTVNEMGSIYTSGTLLVTVMLNDGPTLMDGLVSLCWTVCGGPCDIVVLTKHFFLLKILIT